MKKFFKTTVWMISSVLFCLMPASCGEDNDAPYSGGAEKEIVGKWQKYAVVENDGSLSGGDPDEFWIFNADGSFVNEDSGEITAKGNYIIDGHNLTITSREIDGDREEENFTGTFKIEGLYMDYTFTETGKGNFITFRFLKQ